MTDICNICGGAEFVAGPGGRTARNGRLPKCIGCGSLERHRIVRKVYLPLRTILKSARAITFSEDTSIERSWVRSLEVSIYRRCNSLDVMCIDRPDETYDWIVINHVLEHVKEDRNAISELLRILSPAGVLQVTVPSPAYYLTTDDWGFPDEHKANHYRLYGSDFVHMLPKTTLQVVSTDDVTAENDIVYLTSKCATSMETLEVKLRAAGFRVSKS